MKVACKNVLCKHYHKLAGGEHCKIEEQCEHYSTNRKKTEKQIQKCSQCEYCKRIYTNGMKEYHYECTANGRRRIILMIDERTCDCML